MVREGDDAAFAELWRRHQAVAQRTARYLVRVPSDADDVVSEAFAGILSALRHGSGPRDNFKTYLMACVRNGCRRRRAGPVTTGDDDLDQRSEAFPSLLEDPEKYVEADTVARAFAGLTPRWQHVLWMSEVEDREPHEIATSLRLSDNAAAALTMRARNAFATAYLGEHATQTSSTECAHVASSLAAYVRGTLSASQTTVVERHVSTCPHCARAIDELRDMNKSLRSALLLAPVAAVPAGITTGTTATTLASGAAAPAGIAKVGTVATAGAWAGLPGGTALLVAGAVGALVAGSVLMVDASEPDVQTAVMSTVAPTAVGALAAPAVAANAPSSSSSPTPTSSATSTSAAVPAAAAAPVTTAFSDIPVVVPTPIPRVPDVDLDLDPDLDVDLDPDLDLDLDLDLDRGLDLISALVDDVVVPLAGLAEVADLAGRTIRLLDQMTTEALRAAATTTLPSVTVAESTLLAPAPTPVVTLPPAPSPVVTPSPSPVVTPSPSPVVTLPPVTSPVVTLPPVTSPAVTLPPVTTPSVTIPPAPTLPGLGG